MKKIFVIDWMMIATFPPVLCTGIALHVAAHGADHEVWHAWAVAHVLTGLPLLAAAVLHVRTHRGWYGNIVRSGIGRKGRVTAVLSAVFAFAAVTGIALLGIEGAGSSVRAWHYRTGIVAGILSAGHLLKRLPALRRGSARRRPLPGNGGKPVSPASGTRSASTPRRA